jgi:hypothetical protein
LFPLDDSVIVPGASSETTLAEQMMKLEQRRYCHTRRVEATGARAFTWPAAEFGEWPDKRG